MKNIPYIDLHCHLDGSITLDIARKLAELQNIELPADDAELESKLSVPESCESLNEFLECFALPCSLMQTKEGITESVRLVQEKNKEQGVAYLELRFAPQKHCDKGLTQTQVVEAALAGLKKCDLHTNLILCLMRDRGNEKENLETVELAREFLVKDGGVVAVDLAGAEALFHTDQFAEPFKKAKEYGIPFTIHAGEADGAKSVKDALDYGASRIGHGVRTAEDPALLEYVIKNQIPLEMCPNSNRQTKSVDDMSKYPIRDYLAKGVKVTVNTDDPAICRTTIAKEFEYLEKKFGITAGEKKIMMLNAVDAAFTDDSTKAALRAEVESAF
ncbi:MAG: adenosine deaminase [Spirochaetia bacterium]|nr:adenosine deaminase [Spirochaetia bacterium]